VSAEASRLSSAAPTAKPSEWAWAVKAYAVTVDVINFEQDVDGSSLLDVYWSLLAPKPSG
jgi:hypothetical protein